MKYSTNRSVVSLAEPCTAYSFSSTIITPAELSSNCPLCDSANNSINAIASGGQYNF